MFSFSKGTRSALVIGNSNYDGVAYLENPVNDAVAVSAQLRRLGFKVFDGYDLSRQQIDELYSEYQSFLSSSKVNDVAMIYFSGHGIQENNVNYLVPIGSEQDEKRLVSLQRLIDGIAKLSDRRLVFLDACRSFPNAKEVVQGLMKTRGFEIDDKVLVPDGLAEIDVPKNTFLAFSSAPGKRAYDGHNRELSPFTGALVQYISSVDTPLPNMMAKVRLDVADITNDLQHTWDSSSLVRSFFFNPSSVLLLIGNLIGLIALCFALIPYSLRLYETASPLWITVSVSIAIIVMILFLAGLNEAYARLRGEHIDGGPEGENEDFEIWKFVKQGGTGGVFGGVIAAIAIATPYWGAWKAGEHVRCQEVIQWSSRHTPNFTWPNAIIWPDIQYPWTHTNFPDLVSWINGNCALPFGRLLTEIMVASVLISTVLGIFGLTIAELGNIKWRGAGTLNFLTRNQGLLIGSVAGGVIAGLIIVPLVTLYFGRFDRPFLNPIPVIPGVVFATATIAFSIVNYSLDKFTLKRLGISAAAAVLATLASASALGLFLFTLEEIGFVNLIFNISNGGFYNPSHSHFVQELFLWFGGLVYGAVFGPFLGLLIGITLALTPNR